jgi:LAS superfamily LD-carboxypeptidase LdcB
MDKNHSSTRSLAVPLFGITLIAGFLLYEQLQIKELRIANEAYRSDISDLKLTSAELLMKLNMLDGTVSSTQDTLSSVTQKVGGVEQVVGTISGTVNSLDKLSKLDPQLLRKYSKVYFLNENYTPAHLNAISTEYVYSASRSEQFLAEPLPYLLSMIRAAQADGVTLYVKSAYRSFAEQKALKSQYSVMYGIGAANKFSADQGYSEHQLGTTVDFMTPGLGGNFSGFDGTDAYNWLTNNAHKFGFTLSYPKGNAYYIYEPWHWRYVGVSLATHLHDTGKHFYDLDQREIDTYLPHIFD